ncbi:ABC transporter substrate-binding protein [Pseudonocardia sp. TRM90224]|uniref:ABC transporter substrate-binding protein n=1 Tax=Pseudonocardia sp. TRM90224 TaxID=2812678 RepID=UPI001E353AE0|nr:extracellular solute-binding protein [Pseudonocardia sp. TRM90224]
MRTPARALAATAAAMVLAVTAGACGAAEPDGPPNSITVWTMENLPERLAAQQAIATRFTEATGITVDLVGVAEDQFNQLVMSAAASGELPDVVGAVPLAGVRSLAANELLDPAVSAAVVDDLGADTFSARALELTRDGAMQLAVPSDAWAQLLLYRRDLFAAAGLPEPRTFADVLAAARALDNGDTAGFVGSTIPGDAFTQQTFEHLALANGCELVDGAGEVALDSPPCVESFAFYDDLVRNFSVAGAQDVDSTRATYFAGKAAMVVWSSYILDELAGLRADAAPSCEQCVADPRFLVDNTGVVTALTGPSGREPAQFGEIVSWAVLADAAVDPSRRFVEYMMSDGYVDWLGFAPEGKFPTRTGTRSDPQQYTEAWRTLPAGVDTKAPLADFYPPAVLTALETSPDTFRRWGITQGQGGLVGAMLGELPVPQAISAMTGGEVAPQRAAEQADADVSDIQNSLR